MKNKIKYLLLIPIDILIITISIIYFKITGRNNKFTIQSFIRLFCVSGGFSNDIVSLLTRKKEMDFRTRTIQSGGSIDEELEEVDDSELNKAIEQEDNEDEDTDIEEEIVEDFNLDELTKFYSMEDIENDKNIKETSKLISEAINDKKWEKKITKDKIKIDLKNDDLVYDTKLEDVFSKIYIK